MYNKQTKKPQSITWKQFANRGYCAFASLKREVRIGVLSIATLGIAAQAEAATSAILANHPTQKTDGEEQEMEAVTVTGTMAPLTQLQSARMVSVLSREDIQRAGVQSINDLFKLATGVDVRQRGGFGIQTDISINGGTYEQVTILLNGVNISNPHTGHLAADFPVSVSDIERIEVLEGAASRVYGGQAFGGAINIVTRKEKDKTIEAGAEGGSYGTFLADARLSLTKGNVSNHISGGGGRSDGGTMNDAWKKGQAYWQGDLRHKDFDMSWQLGFSRKSYGANTFYSGSSLDQWEQNERYIASVGAETKGKFHFMPQVYWTRTYDNYHWHKGQPENPYSNSHQSDVYGTRIGGWFSWVAGKTAVNAELRNEDLLSSSLGTKMEEVDYASTHGDGKTMTKKASRTNVSYNIEHNVVLSHWTLSAGLLANMNTAAGNKFGFYPGMDIAYRPSRNWKLFLSYNKGFRLPSYTDLYYNSPDITGNNQLKPETNHSLSLGTKFQTSGFAMSVRGFYNRGHNMIDYVKTKFGDAAHADNFDLDNLGVQAEGRLDFNQLAHKDIWLNTLSLGYTYIHQNRNGMYDIFTSLYAGDYLRHKLTANLNHKIWSNLSATWSLRYQDRMGNYQVYDGIKATDQLCNYSPYATLDLKLQWCEQKYDLYVKGTNITNHKYYDLGNIQQPGIWVMGGARIKM